MPIDRTPGNDKELWQRFAAGGSLPSPRAVSDMDFAAWLEGRLPEGETARIDAAVAADPALRRAALDLSDLLGRPLPVAPARLEVRAKALVGFAVERDVRRGSWLGRLFGSLRLMEKGAMAGVAVVLAGVGFLMGGGLSESYAYQRYGAVATINGTTTGDTAGELGDLFSDGI